MYVIKVKGVAKIPDYVQLRDEAFTLLAYFRVDSPDKSLEKIGLGDKADYIMRSVKEMPFGQIKKIDVETYNMVVNTVIKLKNVDIYQQKHLVLYHVNLVISQGEFIYLIGQSGTGKSSLLKIIYGDLYIGSGEGMVAGFDLKKLH